MIRLDEYRKSLGELNELLSEEEILNLRDQQDQMAEVLFNVWFEEINDKKESIIE